jgi:hypothetical protein
MTAFASETSSSPTLAGRRHLFLSACAEPVAGRRIETLPCGICRVDPEQVAGVHERRQVPPPARENRAELVAGIVIVRGRPEHFLEQQLGVVEGLPPVDQHRALKK